MRPRITGAGEPRIGGSFSVGFEDAGPNAVGKLYYSFQTTRLVFAGCRIYLGAGLFVAGLVTADPNGIGSLVAPVPNEPSLAGLPVYTQWLVADPNGPLAGTSTVTDAMEILLGT